MLTSDGAAREADTMHTCGSCAPDPRTLAGSDIALARRHADECAAFIRRYGALGELAAAAFLCEDHWSLCLSAATRTALDAASLDDVRAMARRALDAPSAQSAPSAPGDASLDAADAPPAGAPVVDDLAAFFGASARCRLHGLAVLLSDLTGPPARLDADSEATLQAHRALLNHKKAHEVPRMARAVQWLALAADAPVRVVDVGSGKGYFGSFLTVGLGVQTVSVEGSGLHTAGAVRRHANVARLFRKRTPANGGEHDMRTAWLDASASADAHDDLLADGDARTVLTGLHACGDLTTTAVGAFVCRPDLWGLVCVGCCYHLMADETFPTSAHLAGHRLALSRSLRMLAQKSVERELRDAPAAPLDAEPDRVLWRPMLSLVLRDSLGVDARARDGERHVGRLGRKCSSWPGYARAAFAQLGVDGGGVSDDELLALEVRLGAQTAERLKKLEVLRLALAPVVEAAIALDRLLYVLESGTCTAAWIVRLFDPVESPRCFGIVCRR